MEQNSLQLLSDLVVNIKYSRYLPELHRRETWDEIVHRCYNMHHEQITKLVPSRKLKLAEKRLDEAFVMVRNKEILPSMRSLQFAGDALKRENVRMFNCSYHPIDCITAFAETMYLLMCGVGVGYSVQARHVDQLPCIKSKNGYEFHEIQDSIEGWSNAILSLFNAYLVTGNDIEFGYSLIRPAGSDLITSGGKAPGPEPLKEAIDRIMIILNGLNPGDRLRPIDVHDIICHISRAVLSGGIRRSALICLFDKDDIQMLFCKSGDWFITNPQRAVANNSAVLFRPDVNYDEFRELLSISIDNGFGEPGIFWTNDKDWACNPCAEIGLMPYQFCNLTEVNTAAAKNRIHFEKMCSNAAYLGTLQATYTNFNYLSKKWKDNTELEALIGVGLTGIASNKIKTSWLRGAAEKVVDTNREASGYFGIKNASRCTTIKPAGTTSCVLGTSSGIHAYHNEYYLRRVQVNRHMGIYKYLSNYHPNLIEEIDGDKACVTLPIHIQKNSIFKKDESVVKFLNRVFDYYKKWIVPGHVYGINTHNVSCSVSYHPEEKDTLIDYLWKYKNDYASISIFPQDETCYQFAPHESITSGEYYALANSIPRIDFSKINEEGDFVDHEGEIACTGGNCDVV